MLRQAGQGRDLGVRNIVRVVRGEEAAPGLQRGRGSNPDWPEQQPRGPEQQPRGPEQGGHGSIAFSRDKDKDKEG
ncbi:hypothetical protein Trco_004174 [Trichoderma cornu-damae]|uniref:Uncharacterized protein n=1 Tax=Trichoderma cornu-damae TaxID=654480 RepID=A0A9P8QMG1_9HYPO|nr:hypothetical protein Trco_004174 [Trichoderma cornu-damae]